MKNYGRKTRQESAKVLEERQKDRTPERQLIILDNRLGKDVGAKKERTRLTKRIERYTEKVKQSERKPKRSKR